MCDLAPDKSGSIQSIDQDQELDSHQEKLLYDAETKTIREFSNVMTEHFGFVLIKKGFFSQSLALVPTVTLLLPPVYFCESYPFYCFHKQVMKERL